MGSLQERLARMGAPDVRFIIVNEKSPQSRALHGELELHAPPGVPVYGQPELGPDIWSILGGAKDDFLIYDRCGRLTFHIRLPFSFLHFPYVESAIRFTHRQDSCGNCSFYPAQVNSTDERKGESKHSPGLEGEGQEPLGEKPDSRGLTLGSSAPTAHAHDPVHGGMEKPSPSLPSPALEPSLHEGEAPG